MTWTLPNILTMLRLLAAPAVAVMFLYFTRPYADWFALLLFVSAAITDWFDGYLARKWDQQSHFGAFLDPVADKLLVGVALVLLVSKHPGFLMAIPAAVIIGREITISALREWMANVGEQTKVAVSIIGKFKTAAQMLAIGFLLFEEPIGRFPTMLTGYLLLYTSAGLTLWSMLLYLRTAWPSLTRDRDRAAKP